MSKKSKTGKNHSDNTGATAPEATSGKKPPRRSATARKSSGARKKKETTTTRAVKGVKPADSHEPTDEQIRIRAYFLCERRHRLGLLGDSDSDWLEAKRQLVSELGQR